MEPNIKSHKRHLLFVFGVIVFIILAVFFGTKLIGRYVLPDLLGNVDLESVGKRAPSFNLPSIDGKHIKLGQFAGTPVVIVFWTTWNKQSADQVKIFDDYVTAQGAQAKLVNILAINSQEDESIATSFIKRGGYSVQTLFDSYGDVSTLYGIKSLPTTYFIAKDGSIYSKHTGVLNESEIIKRVEELLRQGSV